MKLSAKQVKVVTLGLGSVLMMGAGQAAFAHASILNAIDSGATGFSRVGVNHACNHTSPSTPVVAQSVVFPTINPTYYRIDYDSAGKALTPVALTGSLGDYFATSQTGSTVANGTMSNPTPPALPADISAPLTSFAGAAQLVQSRDVFNYQIEQRNNNVVIGWVSAKGSLGLNLHGEVPFRFTAPHFRNNNCVKSLKISIPVADICNTTQQPPLAPSLVGLGVNIWVDNKILGLNVAGYPFPVLETVAPPAPAVQQTSIENGAGTTVLTINRNVLINPYPSNCAAAGGVDPLYDISVLPSADDIKRLQFPGWGTPEPGATFL